MLLEVNDLMMAVGPWACPMLRQMDGDTLTDNYEMRGAHMQPCLAKCRTSED